MLSRCPPTARSPSPGARRRSTSSTWRACARPRSRPSRRPGRDGRLRHVGRLRAAARVDRRAARRRGRAGARHQRLDAGRRVPVRAARRSRRHGRRRVARPTTARCSTCATAAPTSAWSSCEHGRDRHRRRRGARSRAASRPKLAHIIPNFQNPAGYTLSAAKRDALLALAAEHDFTIFEDDPYIAIRFEGETLPTMLSLDDARQGRLRLVVLEDRLPGHPRRLPRRARRP